MTAKTLKTTTRDCVSHYLSSLEGETAPSDLYKLVISEVEYALLDAVMDYAKQNQSNAATFLGLNRGTLRKKLKEHGLL